MALIEQTRDRSQRKLLLLAALAVATGVSIGLLVVASWTPVIPLLIVAAVFVVYATLAWPEWGLVVLIFLAYTRFSDVFVHSHGTPSVLQPFMVLLLLAAFIRWILYSDHPRGWERTALLLGGYGLVGFFSLLYAADPYRAQMAFVTYVKDAAIALVIVLLLQDGLTFRRVIWALILAGVLMGTISVWQQLTGTFDNSYAGFGGARVQHIVGETSDYRVAGPVNDPNFYGQILVVLVPLALSRFWREKRRHWRFLAAWALIVCLLSIVFSFSRGAFLASFVVLGLMMLRRPPSVMALLLTVAIAIPLLQFVPNEYVERVRTIPRALAGFPDISGEASLRGRTSEVVVGWLMFVDHPILGVGLDNYPVHYQSYSRSLGLDQRREARHAHSLYFQIASETGMLGLIAFGAILWFAFAGLQQSKAALNRAGFYDYASMIDAFTIGLAGYLLAALFLHAAFPRYLWILLGIALAVPQVAKDVLARHGSKT